MSKHERLTFPITVKGDFYITQDGRAVVIRDRQTDRDLQRFEPPISWRSLWTWTERADGRAIIMEGRSHG